MVLYKVKKGLFVGMTFMRLPLTRKYGRGCSTCSAFEELGFGHSILGMFSSEIYRQIFCSQSLTLFTLVVNCRCWWLLLLVRTIMVGRNDYK